MKTKEHVQKVKKAFRGDAYDKKPNEHQLSEKQKEAKDRQIREAINETFSTPNGKIALKYLMDIEKLSNRLKSFLPNINIHLTDVNEVIKFETPLAAHYTVIK
jgi:small nuclear ribonucleoprotein (snRNP)-like protein